METKYIKEICEDDGTLVITEKNAPAGMGRIPDFSDEDQDELYAEACSEAEQAEQEARCAEYEAAEAAREQAEADDAAAREAQEEGYYEE